MTCSPSFTVGISLSGASWTICSISSATLSSAARNRTLLAGLAQPPQDLVAIVRLARAVLLDHRERDLVDALVGGEAAAARQAFPSTTDHQAVLPLARVDHLVLDMRAEGTSHGVLEMVAIFRTSAGRTPPCHMKMSPSAMVGRSVMACSMTAAAPALASGTPQNPLREIWHRNS